MDPGRPDADRERDSSMTWFLSPDGSYGVLDSHGKLVASGFTSATAAAIACVEFGP